MKHLQTILVLIIISYLSVICISAQNSASLGDTEWGVTATDYYKPYFPSPVTVIYSFGENNEAKVLVSFVYAPAPLTTFDVATGQYKTQYYSPTIQNASDTNGTFKQNGNTVRIEFSDHIINAIMKGNNMTGEVTDKKSNTKIKWEAERVSRKNNTVSAGDITGLSTSGDGESSISNRNKIQDKTDSSVKIKTGNYKIAATQSFSDLFGGAMTENIAFTIKIESVDANGNVKAHLYKGGGEGQLEGRVDEKGVMQLEGFYTDNFYNKWNFKLKSTIINYKLNGGSFIDVSSHTEVKGIINETTSDANF